MAIVNNAWKIDGVYFPRNPSNFSRKPVPPAVSYPVMSDGSQRRVTVANKFSASVLLMEWAYADQRIKNFFLPYCDSQTLHKITLGGVLPAQEVWCYLDAPEQAMSAGVYHSRVGEGGTRMDLKITAQTDLPYAHSANVVPLATPSAAQVLAWWGGPTGSAYDGLPVWNGAGWSSVIPSNSLQTVNFSNLGTAVWSPVIRMVGPFNTGAILSNTTLDVDGTGAGVRFTWNGANIAAGDAVLFDTKSMRVYTVISGVKAETYAWSATLNADGITPFAYWPGYPPGTFGVPVQNANGMTLDLSNNGTNTFWYW